jgi:Ni,Fe-hydrogenase I large subunit
VESTLSLFGQGLMARLAARLAEAGRVIGSFSRGNPEVTPGQDTLRAMAAPNGWGAGIVHSARGMLIHALRLDGWKVADFRILAPTEWNFHPEGAVVRALQSLGRDEGFGSVRNQQRLALLVAAAYDPCVHCNIFVQRTEAGHA